MFTVETFGNFQNTVLNQYLNNDDAFGAQCWDLTAELADYYGLPRINCVNAGPYPGYVGSMVTEFPQSEAIAKAYTLVDAHETIITGDVVVWGETSYTPSTHVAIGVLDNGGDYVLCLSQNSSASRADNPYPEYSTGPTILQWLPRYGIIGLIRPNAGVAPQGTITQPINTESEQTVAGFTIHEFLNYPAYDGGESISAVLKRLDQDVTALKESQFDGGTSMPEGKPFKDLVNDQFTEVRASLSAIASQLSGEKP